MTTIPYYAAAKAKRATPTYLNSFGNSNGAAVTLTGIASGKFVLVLNGRSSSTPPSTPGNTTIISELNGLVSGAGVSLVGSWRFTTGADEVIPAATSSNRTNYVVYDDVDPLAPILGTTTTSVLTSGTTATVPALLLPDPGLIVVGLIVDDVTTTPNLAVNSTLSVRRTQNSTDSPHTVGDTNGSVVSFSSINFTIATSEPSIGYSLGLRGRLL